MSNFEVDVPACWQRLERLYHNWEANKDDETWNSADTLILVAGSSSPDENSYKRSAALQIWLFGYEYPETLVVFCKGELYILTSAKKVNLLTPVTKEREGKKPPVPIQLLTRDKDNKESFDKIIEAIKKSFDGKIVGTLDPKKEKNSGSFAEAWETALKESGLDTVTVDAGFANVLAVKDEKEQKNIRTAAAITTHILKGILLPNIETVIDEEQKVTHTELAEKTEKIFEDPSKISKKLNPDAVDSCYSTFIQSGGEYDLRPGMVPSDDDQLHFGTIVCALGARFKSYCSNVARTYFVDPTKEQENNYKILLEVLQILLKSLTPGVKLNSLYTKAIKYIESKKPELVEKFLKSCGCSMGIQFQESMFNINAKNERTVEAGMVFNLTVGIQNVENPEATDPKKKVYSILICDTVLVKEDGEAESLTEKCAKKFTDISYFLEGEEEQPKKVEVKVESKRPQTAKPAEKEPPKPKPKNAEEVEHIVETKFRDSTVQRIEAKSKTQILEDKRKEHQKKLEEKKRKEAEERFAKRKDKKDKDERDANLKIVESYADTSEYPKDILRNKIYIDPARESILLPIYGILVPFHVSTIKNASKTDEQYLRINFVTPDQTVLSSQKKVEGVPSPTSIRVKEITYRSPDVKSLNNALRMIKELRKRISVRDEQKRIKDEIVVQEKLVINKGRNPRLSDIFVRPNPTGRRTIGVLEAHTNGFRFSTLKGGNIDILYKNIKHAFFQPAENDLLVMIHFHLHNAIMIGKKKAQDVQFCTEVMEVSQSLDGRGYRRDENELEDEQRERAMRARLNNEFQTFVKKVEELVDFEFDIPYNDLGFYGVPHRSSVFLTPTVHSLVNLAEQPFFVISLADVEIAYFERVQFSLKNFDLVIVFSDYDKPVIHINSISVEYLETIKEWLDSCDIKYYEGTQNLNWTRIMNTIQADPKKFHTEDGGWSFLNPESSSENEHDEEGESSEFDPDEEEGSEEVGEEEEEAYSSEPDEDEWESEEGDSEGEDWDALEEKARQEDQEKAVNRLKRGRGDYSGSEEEDAKPKKSSKAQKQK